MVYKPRNISRTPFMNRLKEMTNAMLEEATIAQEKGTIEAVKFAEKFAHFIEKLRGIRLRAVAESEMSVRARVLPVMVRRAMMRKPVGVQDEQPGPSSLPTGTDPVLFTDIKPKEDHDVKDFIKEEPLCEVDATPFPVEPLLGPPGTISALKKEIKEEWEEEPSTSSAMQQGPSGYLEDNDVYGQICMPRIRLQPLRRPPPMARVRDGMNYKVVPYESGQPAVTVWRATKRPASNADLPPPSKQAAPVEDLKLQAFLEAKQSATSLPSTKFVPAARSSVPGTSTSVFDHLGSVSTKLVQKKIPAIKLRDGTTSSIRVIERTEDYDVIGQKIIRPSADFNLGQRVVQCEYCNASVNEREIVKHIKSNHGPETRSVAMRCQDFACDFICKTEKERIEHEEFVHCDPYPEWKNKGRFKLTKGTHCPYCLHRVNDVFALCKHLFHDHALKINSQATDIYSCSGCNFRFPRLHLVYEHWHENTCPGASIKIDKCAMTIPPPAIIEVSKDMGPKGKKGSQPIVGKE